MLLLLHPQDSPFLRPCSSASKPSNAGLDVCASPQSPSAAAAAAVSDERGNHCVLQEKIEAERDDSQTKGQAPLSKDYFHSSSVRGDGEGQKESTVGDKDGDSTTVWSSLELDMSYGQSHKGESCANNSVSSLSLFIYNRCISGILCGASTFTYQSL